MRKKIKAKSVSEERGEHASLSRARGRRTQWLSFPDFWAGIPEVPGHSWLAPPRRRRQAERSRGRASSARAWRGAAWQRGISSHFSGECFSSVTVTGLVSHSSHLLKTSLSPPLSLCVRERARLSVSLCACLRFRGMQRVALGIPLPWTRALVLLNGS